MTGQIVSSQAYIDRDEDIDKDFVDTGPHDHDTTVSGEGDAETEWKIRPIQATWEESSGQHIGDCHQPTMSIPVVLDFIIC